MKRGRDEIVFLDAGTVNYGDLSWESLRKLGSLKIFPRTSKSQILSRIRGAHIVITNKCVFDRRTLSKAKALECICLSATGTNNVDLDAARERGIAVANVSGYSTDSVVQWTFAFILALAGDLKKLDQVAHSGAWSRSFYFTWAPNEIIEVKGKTLGIVGYGAIGRGVARIARSIGMKVLIARIPERRYSAREGRKRVNFLSVMRRADIVSVHTPLTPFTRDLIDQSVLRRMKRGAFLINMARGGIVNEKALYRALKSGHLRGAATDVLTQEPPPRNHILLKAPHLLMTPHIAWASREARKRLLEEIALNVGAFQKGKRRNRVD